MTEGTEKAPPSVPGTLPAIKAASIWHVIAAIALTVALALGFTPDDAQLASAGVVEALQYGASALAVLMQLIAAARERARGKLWLTIGGILPWAPGARD